MTIFGSRRRQRLLRGLRKGLRLLDGARRAGKVQTFEESEEHVAVRAESVFSGPYSSCGLPDTTFLAATDEAGNVCAFIGSNANYFGCAVVEEHGFAVHCRGAGFCLEAGHPNCFGPRKKPYHSVMPVMVTDASSHDWLCTTGTMGGYAQTSIITQLLLNMMELDLDPQQAVAKARFLLGTYSSVHPDGPLAVEAGYPEEALRTLRQRGHPIKDTHADKHACETGHAHVLARGSGLWTTEQVARNTGGSPLATGATPAVWCGTDPRCNGAALGY